MPEHTSFFTYLLAKFSVFEDIAKGLGHTAFGKPMTAHDLEPFFVSMVVALLLALGAYVTRARIANYAESVIPEDKITVRTIMELLVGYVYNTMKDVMGAERAKKYFPVVGTSAFFIFFSNLLGLFPGFSPPTGSWDITLGCAIVVFVAFNYYGLKENGISYLKHLAGPVWWLAWLILPIEIMSLLIRPITLSVRLMLNMSVDHLVVSIFHGLFMWVLPVAVMILGTLVIAVQAYVFALLSSVYIALATEHEDHGEHAKDHDGHLKKTKKDPEPALETH